MVHPLISIIIPVYNVENYLATCLDSILNQSYQDFEVILIDDGSKDSSPKICDKYAAIDSRFRVIHQPNSGVSKARNIGLSVANSEWITFIDSDDWVDPDFLSNFNGEQYRESDLICQGLKYIEHSTKEEKRRKVFNEVQILSPDREQLVKRYDVLGFGVTVCKCFKRAIIERNNLKFNEEISYHEDHLFTLEYIRHTYSIMLSKGCGYNYRFGHNSNSLSQKTHSWQSQEAASKKMIESLKRICTVYCVENEYYSQMMSFCLGPKLNAVRDVYHESISLGEKKKIMMDILNPLDDFSAFYTSASRRSRPIGMLARDKSGFLLHLYFIICSRLWK